MSDWWKSDQQVGVPQAPTPAKNWWDDDKTTAPAAAPPPANPEMGWGDVGVQAVKNIPSSAVKFGSDLIQPILHPIETAKAIGNVGQGAMQKMGVMSGDDSVKYADAVGEFFKNRYGSMEAAKKTLAEDPVGIAADLSLLLTGGGAAAARAPGVLGKVGEAARAAGTTIDPINVAGKAIKYPAIGAGKAAAEIVGGLGTHTGAESLKTAMRSGYEGGKAGEVFRENMRGTAPMADPVVEAKHALENIRKERGDVYRDMMATHIAPDMTVLSMRDIGDALRRVQSVQTYKGQNLSPSTAEVRKSLEDAVFDWARLPQKDFHTAEGLDALKRKVGDIMETTKPGTTERLVAGDVYNSIKQTIVKQAPEYAKIMKGYENASGELKELEKTLSLGKGATIDTSLRKLQSVLRDNVNTSFGRRRELAQYLVDNGAPQLMEKLAGQALKPWTARGLGKLSMQVAAEVAIMLGLAGGGIPSLGHAAKAAAILPAMSPRIAGETAHATGRLGRGAEQAISSKPIRDFFYQYGRTSNASENP